MKFVDFIFIVERLIPAAIMTMEIEKKSTQNEDFIAFF